MISAICESPLTLRAIMNWRRGLVEGQILLRDVIDLDATYGSEATAAGMDSESDADESEDELDNEEGADESGGQNQDGEDSEASVSLAMMEMSLTPQVLETFDNIASTYGKAQRLMVKREEASKDGPSSTAQPSAGSRSSTANWSSWSRACA